MIKQQTFITPTTVNSGDLNAIRQSAKRNSPDALRKAAQEFEALFMNMVLKSMRKTTFESGLFSNSQTKMYTSILDQELSQVFAKRGIGLADALVRQMQFNQGGVVPTTPGSENQKSISGNDDTDQAATVRAQQLASSLNRAFMISSLAQGASDSASNKDGLSSLLETYQTQYQVAASDQRYQSLIDSVKAQQSIFASELTQIESTYSTSPDASRPAHVQSFIDRMAPYAEQVSRETGIPASFMLAQAALETGWGQKEIVMADGSSSHNLFGIKAGRSWGGKVAVSRTTEFENGVAVKRNEPFRAYSTYAESFRDYANLISRNPRYRAVMESGNDPVRFAQGLQDAGYATDPQYAAKLTRIIQHSLAG